MISVNIFSLNLISYLLTDTNLPSAFDRAKKYKIRWPLFQFKGWLDETKLLVTTDQFSCQSAYFVLCENMRINYESKSQLFLVIFRLHLYYRLILAF